MVVCKFYLQGNCKFGTRCRNEHPREEQHTFQSKNRFSALQDNRSRAANSGRRSQDYPYNLDPSILEKDLRYELPAWIFSCYGPGSDVPRQLFGGFPLEQSPEEMRTMYYLGMATGNVDQAINAERELAAKSHRHIQEILNDPEGAIRYVAAGAKLPDNRWEICNRYRGSSSSTTATNQQRPGWTGPGISDNRPPPHHEQAFGRPSQLAHGSGSFGQPSTLGQGAASSGKPSTFVQDNLFSQSNQQPSKPNVRQATSFGRPSTIGQPSTFGQLSGGSGQTQNGALNQFPSQNNQLNSGFTNTQAPFGQPTSQGPLGPGGSNSSGGFPQYSGFNNNNNNNNNNNLQPSNTGFGSGFGSGNNVTDGFTQNQSQPQNLSAPFTTNSLNHQQQQPSSNSQSNLNLNPTLHPESLVSPSLSTYTTHNSSKLITFHNHPVTYISNVPYYAHRPTANAPSHGFKNEEKVELERIWFPDGPPAREARRIETALDDNGSTNAAAAASGGNGSDGGGGGGISTQNNNNNNNDSLPNNSTVLKEAQDTYVHLAMHDAFNDGIMPEIAPRWEWIRWDV